MYHEPRRDWIKGGVPKWLRERTANPRCGGSNPPAASILRRAAPTAASMQGRRCLQSQPVRMTITGAWRNWQYAEGLKPSVRKDLQVRILPPLPFIFRESNAADSADIPKRAYTYLLGMYLGDGHIARARKSYRLQIYLHVRNGDRIRRVVPGRIPSRV